MCRSMYTSYHAVSSNKDFPSFYIEKQHFLLIILTYVFVLLMFSLDSILNSFLLCFSHFDS